VGSGDGSTNGAKKTGVDNEGRAKCALMSEKKGFVWLHCFYIRVGIFFLLCILFCELRISEGYLYCLPKQI
jgi:hypothetical protein